GVRSDTVSVGVTGRARTWTACCVLALCVPAPVLAAADRDTPSRVAAFSVGYASLPGLRAAVTEEHATVVRRLASLRVAEVRARPFVGLPGLRFVQRITRRLRAAEPPDPALAPAPGQTAPWEWQFTSAGEDAVPESVLRAAGSVTIAVIDTGADLDAPD